MLLEVQAVGICGSDYGLFLGKHPLSQFPRVQGHEFSAKVLAFGEDTRRDLPIGALVVVEPLLPCGRCYPCRRGSYNCCVELRLYGVHVDGGLQSRVVVPEHLLHDARGLTSEVAAFAEPMSIALQGLRRAQVVEGERMVVFGAGPVGQAAIIAARDIGASVAAVDLVDERLQRATESGAELVVNSADEVLERLREWSDGEGPGVVVDATGAPAALSTALDLVAPSGRVVMIGISDKEVPVPVALMTRKAVSLLGSRNSAGIFGEAVALVRRHQQEVRSLITHIITLEDVPDTIRLALADPRSVEKIIVRMAG
ncbi:MAG: zinc-binding dehydrogenase [Candidatus Microbacterium stercoravium]